MDSGFAGKSPRPGMTRVHYAESVSYRLFVIAHTATLIADAGDIRFLRHRDGAVRLREVVTDRHGRSFLGRVVDLLAQRRAVLFLERSDVRTHEGRVDVGGKFAVRGIEAEDIQVAIDKSAVSFG